MKLKPFDIFSEVRQPFTSIEEAHRCMADLRQRFGVANVSYWKLGRQGPGGGRAGWISTYDEDWMRRYRLSGYFTVDPVFKDAFRRMLPLDWDEVNSSTPKAREICSGAQSFGIIPRGISFPIVDADGSRALFSINVDLDDDREWKAIRAELAQLFHLVAHYFHVRISDTLDAGFMDDEEVELSMREKQVLELAAEGKTAPQIAEELRLSVSAVRLYTSNLLHKLGATNKTQAVAIAFRKGLL
jgi:DNA-binding CsgD family transcriptional regulator